MKLYDKRKRCLFHGITNPLPYTLLHNIPLPCNKLHVCSTMVQGDIPFSMHYLACIDFNEL